MAKNHEPNTFQVRFGKEKKISLKMFEVFFDMAFYFYIWSFFLSDLALLISNGSFHALMALSSKISLYLKQFCYFLWEVHSIHRVTSFFLYKSAQKIKRKNEFLKSI